MMFCPLRNGNFLEDTQLRSYTMLMKIELLEKSLCFMVAVMLLEIKGEAMLLEKRSDILDVVYLSHPQIMWTEQYNF